MLASTREDEPHGGGPVDAGFGHALFRNNHTSGSSRHRLKAQTLQPDGRMFLMQKYFSTQAESAISPWAPPTTYANVPLDQGLPMTPVLHHHQQGPAPHQSAHHVHHHSRQQSRHSHRSHNHQHLHARSHSQHYYQSMLSQGLNELNCYYNMPHGMERARHSPIMNEPPPPPPMHPIHNQPDAHMDSITVLQVCNELYNNIDSLPPMPSSRKYSISSTQGGLFKVAFPQTRTMKVDFHDQNTKTLIKAGETISVLEPAKEDRSKFSICYKDKHIDLPHQFTQAAPIRFNLYYNQGYVDSHNSPMRHQLTCQTNAKRCM